MYTNACSLDIRGIYSSGIILSIERGEIISVTSVNLLGSINHTCTVWIQLGHQHNNSILQCNAKVIFSSLIPNKYLDQFVCSFFIFVRIVDCTFSHLNFEPLFPVSYFTCFPILQGDKVLVVGSPFGPLCPQVLINNQFRGTVAISIGSESNMLLIDLFCPLGLVGAPVYIIKNDLPLLYGLLINDSNFVNKNNSELILTSIFPVVSIKEISEFLLVNGYNSYFNCIMQLSRFTPIINPIVFRTYSSLIPQTVLSRVVKIQNDNIFASGILLANNICITCAHVISNLVKGEIINVIYPNNSGLVSYELLYATPPNTYPDVAFLIKFGTTFNPEDLIDDLIPYCKDMTIGREILSISYQNIKLINSTLTVTFGCINKLVKHQDNVLFGQSSCCVTPGSSGGLVIDRNSFEVIGMISGFTRLEMLGITYFYSQISRFITFEILNQFWNCLMSESNVGYIRNDYVQGLWNYNLTDDVFISKL